ncbi:plasmid mobilization relaxosome protein MobC [Eubacterium sp. 1001713B170207_170306_E7]|uniref:plasmid mobilization protein n=1 Tax=Eubacterium sp. 1001713B170207_170306_E7 TaxID=2787097 RepID=UPI001896ED54|nr:plasmid mobilization relaxosome protein MobC [Eubacterium sp. 1001713B170207_170306_E7]
MAEQRNKGIYIKFTQHELKLLKQKMNNANIKNRSGFIRKMAIDGYVIQLDIKELKEISRLLGITANNVNQLAKMANSTGNVYVQDIEGLDSNLKGIRVLFGEILTQLSGISG